MTQDMGASFGPGSRASTEPSGLGPSGFDPSRWPSSADVLAELRRRNPAQWGGVRNFHYTPGTGGGATIAQIADQMEKVEQEMADPRRGLAGRLDGKAFLLEDACTPQTDFRGGWPGVPVVLTPEQAGVRRTYSEAADLMRAAAEQLRADASAIEARSGETACGLDPKDESAA